MFFWPASLSLHIAYILDRYRPLARFIIYRTLGASKLLAQARSDSSSP
jgi:hypothetical protein